MKITKAIINRVNEINEMIIEVNKHDETIEMDSSSTWGGNACYVQPIKINKNSISIPYQECWGKLKKGTDVYYHLEDIQWALKEIRKGCKKALKYL